MYLNYSCGAQWVYCEADFRHKNEVACRQALVFHQTPLEGGYLQFEDPSCDQRDICFGHLLPSPSSAHFSKKISFRCPVRRSELKASVAAMAASARRQPHFHFFLARACLCLSALAGGLPAVQSMPIIQAKGGMNHCGHGHRERQLLPARYYSTVVAAMPPPPPPIVYEQWRGVSPLPDTID